ncbi:MAG TPA: ribonuclease H-like domain-containing protein [Anaerolineae bacterium]|nr:ribonuclease H-like domain-containing protein [Anaerolineae bacterium]
MNTLFFDLETQRLFDEVGGRHNIRMLGLSVAVTYSSADEAFHHYLEEDAARLIADLQAADRVVGFNLLTFDYEVLRAYKPDFSPPATVDMLDQIYRRLGYRVSLDNLATTTLGVAKSADGLQAVAWYREGRIQEVLDYCQQDVDVTRRLYEFGHRNKHLKFHDGRYRVQSVPVSW